MCRLSRIVFFCEIGDSFIPVAGKKNLELITEIDKDLQGAYLGDPFRIRQVVNNLLSNAIKIYRKRLSFIASQAIR